MTKDMEFYLQALYQRRGITLGTVREIEMQQWRSSSLTGLEAHRTMMARHDQAV